MYVYESISIQNSRIYVDIRPAAVAPRERRQARARRFIKHISQNHRPSDRSNDYRVLARAPNSFLTITNLQMRCAQ